MFQAARFAVPFMTSALLLPSLAVAQNQTFVTFCNRTASDIRVSFSFSGDSHANAESVLANRCFSESLTSYQGDLRVAAVDSSGMKFTEKSVTVTTGTSTVVSFETRCDPQRKTPASYCVSRS